MSGFNFNFQAESFIVGVGAGWGTAYAFYRAQKSVQNARRRLQSTQNTQEFAARGADAGYLRDLVRWIEKDHLAGERVPLSKLLVEPRFLKLPELAAPSDEDTEIERSVFHSVPFVPDHPYIAAPYNVESLSIEDLSNGDHMLALLGLPGSGRTSALHAIALWSLGRVEFAPAIDPVQARLDKLAKADAESFSDEEAQAMQFTGVQAEQMARQALERKSGVDLDDETETFGSRFRQLTPFYAHLSLMNTNSSDFGRTVDPAEPVVRALQSYSGYVTRKTIAGKFYERLRDGRALLLIDGYDEIAEADRPAVDSWIAAFIQEYDENYLIVTGPARGYAGMAQAGLTPVFMQPMLDLNINLLADRWAENWGAISGARRRAVVEVDTVTLKTVKSQSRALTPFELSLKLWAMYNSPDQASFDSWMTHYLTQIAPSVDFTELRQQVAAAASLQISEDRIIPAHLNARLLGIEPTGEDAANGNADFSLENELDDLVGDSVDDLDHDEDFDLDNALDDLELNDDLYDEDSPEADLADLLDSVDSTDDADSKKRKDAASERVRLDKTTVALLKTLSAAGLVRADRGGGLRFQFAPIAHYFASLALSNLSEGALISRADDPRWGPAMPYAALHTDLTPVVNARLEAPPDVLYNRHLEAASWLRYLDERPDWMPDILRHLGRLFTARNQFPTVRQRVAAALIGTRERSVQRIFERGITHPVPAVRVLSCLGLGAMKVPGATDELSALLADEDSDVSLAAGLGLGAIGTQESLEEMAVALTSGSERLRQAVAEAFAAIPGEGYPVLFDAIQGEDGLMRRAAVFGLRRINTTWALIAIYRASVEDEEWYVKDAADQVFVTMGVGDQKTIARQYPAAEAIPWARDWVKRLGETAVRMVKDGNDLLRKALDEGDPEVQRLSVTNMGQLGLYDQAPLLYQTLRHRDPDVRAAAFAALGDMQLQIDRPLPAPN